MKINSIKLPIISPYFKSNNKDNKNNSAPSYYIMRPTTDGFFRVQKADLKIFSDVEKLINGILDEMRLERDIDEYFLMLSDQGIQETLKKYNLLNEAVKNNSANKILCNDELDCKAIEELLDEAGLETFGDVVRFAKKFYDNEQAHSKVDMGWIEALKIHGILDDKDNLLKYGEILAVLYDSIKESKTTDEKDFSVINDYCVFLNKINLKNTDNDFTSRFSYLASKFNNFECATDKIAAIEYLYKTYPKKLDMLAEVLGQESGVKYKNIEQTYKMTDDVVDYIFERNKGKSLDGFEEIAPMVLRKKKFLTAGLNKVASYFNNFQTGKDRVEFYEFLVSNGLSIKDFNNRAQISPDDNASLVKLIENKNKEPEIEYEECESELEAQSIEEIESEKEIFENEYLKEAYYKIVQSLQEAKKRVPSGNSVNNYFKKYASNDRVDNLVKSIEALPDNISFKRYLLILDEIQKTVDEFEIDLKINNDNILNIDVSDYATLKMTPKKLSFLLGALSGGLRFNNPVAYFKEAFSEEFYHPRYNIAYDLVKNRDSKDCAYNTMLKELRLEKKDLGLSQNCTDFVYIKAIKDALSKEFVDFINSSDWIDCFSKKKDSKKFIPNMSLHAKLRIIARFVFDDKYSGNRSVDLRDEKTRNTIANILNTIYDTTPKTIEKSREGDRIVTTSNYNGKTIETVFNNQGQMITIFPKF